ncbi:MAG: hypothetical protein ABI207_04525 [Crocinitomicaceae bacterium]
MKSKIHIRIKFIILLMMLILSSCKNSNSSVKQENKINPKQKLQNKSDFDSSWTYTEYNRNGLRVNIINHNLENFSIDVITNKHKRQFDLNKLNIDFKTPELNWVNDQFICISTWYSGPFGRNIFLPTHSNTSEFIYIDKDIELTDSMTNNILYIDSVINKTKIILIAENLVSRKKQIINLKISKESEFYPYYDSVIMNKNTVSFWIQEKKIVFDIKKINYN